MSPATSALDWLYATQMFGVKLGLDNARRLLRERLAYPAAGVKVLHVAGTNGKGSVCAVAESVARAAGLRTGLFTSPHLVDFRERIRVDGEMIPAQALEAELECLRRLVAGWDPHPTFFELALAVAMRFFRDRGVELIVLETGMGGRLDATTAVPADVAVITPIGLDHTQWLGDTLEAIAAEKAAIIVPGKPVLSASQDPAARRVIEETANERRAPLVFVEQPLGGYGVPLPGQHQKRNAALAVEALHCLGIPLKVDAVRSGLADTRWPGRFESRPAANVVLDAAHNPHGAAVLAATWREEFGDDRATLIFGAASDKDATGMLRLLRPLAVRLVLCPPDSPRAADGPALREAAAAADYPDGVITECATLAQAWSVASSHPERILIAGSIFLVGQATALLEGRAVRASAQ